MFSKLQAPGIVFTPWKSYFWGKVFLSNEVFNFIQSDQMASVSASKYHYLFLNKEGKAFGFGENDHGQLGIGSMEQFVAAPTPVKTELRFEKVVAGFAHSLFLSLDDNNLYGCGYNSSSQATGDGRTSKVNTLQAISIPGLVAGEKVMDFCAGNSHTLILTDEGRVFSLGYNGYGQLGLGHKLTDLAIHEITSLKEITSIATQGSSSFCLDNNGNVWAWGRNDHGQLGFGNTKEYLVPTQIETLKDYKIKTIHSGYLHTAVVTNDGKVLVFGDTTEGQCGLTGESILIENMQNRLEEKNIVKNPTLVSIPNEEIQSVLLGHNYTLYLTNNFNVYGCGNGTTGHLGEDNIMNKKINNPVKINELVVEILSEDYYEVKKNARKLFLVYSKDPNKKTYFSWLPRDVLLTIAAFTGGKSAIQDPKGSMQIAASFFKGKDNIVKEDKNPENKKVEPQFSTGPNHK